MTLDLWDRILLVAMAITGLPIFARLLVAAWQGFFGA